MKEYKLRAECAHDISEMIKAIRVGQMTMNAYAGFPDVELVFTSDLSLAEIKNRLAEIPDGHVMAETVAPIESYSGNRG